jgi:zinc protease
MHWRSVVLALSLVAPDADAQATVAGPPQDPPAALGSSTARGDGGGGSPGDGAGGVPRLPFQKYKLDNGLEVILHEDHRQPIVTVDVSYRVGSLAEEPGRSGFAHLLEHLMFQGSAHVDGDRHFRYLEEAGAADVNGATDFDRTTYSETVPRNELELALWLEADRMGWLMPVMSQARLDEQRSVVKNERRQTVENEPYGLAEEKLWQAIFPASHPFHGAVIGTMAELDRASLQDVRRFYDRFYAPSNATLCIVGDFDPVVTRKLVDKYFRSLPAWPRPSPRAVQPPRRTSELRVDHEETVGTLPLVEVLWLTPGRGEAGYLELEVLARVLGDGIASKMQDALLVQSELAQEVTVEQLATAHVSVFAIRAVVRPGVATDDVLNTIQAQLDYLADVPVTAEEVVRARSRLETETVFALQSTATRAALLQDGNHFTGDPGAFATDIAKVRTVTADDVMTALKTHLSRDRRAVLVARPVAAGASPSAAAAAPSQGTP